MPEWIEKRLAEIPPDELHIFSCREIAGVIEWGYVLSQFPIRSHMTIGGMEYQLSGPTITNGYFAYQIGGA